MLLTEEIFDRMAKQRKQETFNATIRIVRLRLQSGKNQYNGNETMVRNRIILKAIRIVTPTNIEVN